MTALPRATYDDLAKLADDQTGEIIDGRLIGSRRGSWAHVTAWLVEAIARRYSATWRFVTRPQLRLGADVLVPDLAGWRRDRMPRPPTGSVIELPPDWVCDVLTEDNGGIVRVRKAIRYARARVGYRWLLDPHTQLLEVMQLLPRDEWLLCDVYSEEPTVRPEPFAGIELALAPLWILDAP
jgi:Uma2 family endonuclease